MNEAVSRNIISQIWQIIEWFRVRVNYITNHPRVTTFASLLIFLWALQIIGKELNVYSPNDISQAFDDVRISTTLMAIISAIISFLALSFSDRYCLSMLGKRLPYSRTIRASLATYALSKTLGYSWAVASTARARLYRKWGLTQGEIGALSMTSGTMVWLGALSVAAFGVWVGAAEISRHGKFNVFFWWGFAAIISLPAFGWWYFSKKGPLSFNWGPALIYRPRTDRALAHLAVAMFDKIGAALALYVLLPDFGGWSFPAFLAVFTLAGILGALSGAPGGLGVFEAAILAMAPNSQNIPGAAVALVFYRLIYNIIPLFMATIILGLDHAAALRPAAQAAKKIGNRALNFGPQILAILVFACGYLMLSSAATPSLTARIVHIEAYINPMTVEVAHFLTAIIGVALMIIASGLWKEGKAYFWLSAVLIYTGIILLLTKGIAWEIALFLTFVFGASFYIRADFDKSFKEIGNPLKFSWIAAIIGSLTSIGWMAYFTYKNTKYSNLLWFQTGVEADVARSLRAMAGAISFFVLISFIIWLFAPIRAKKAELNNSLD